jgi:RNA-directed DNA polymerase
MFEWLLDLIGYQGHGYAIDELSRRLDVATESLTKAAPAYREFEIRKRCGGSRRIAAPSQDLKILQRRMLRRLFSRLRVHPAATGFQRGESFVTNARRHQAKAIVISFDIKDFFPSITADRVRRYFRAIGWNRQATQLLVRLVTWQGRLPQGAPTSPRLSNLVNYRMDTRLTKLAERFKATYTRYADDITISLEDEDQDLHSLIGRTIAVLRSEGYQPHLRRKFDVRRRHQRQEVTGLVVNSQANLSRTTRRWLRAVEYRTKQFQRALDFRRTSQFSGLRSVQRPTLSDPQLAG